MPASALRSSVRARVTRRAATRAPGGRGRCRRPRRSARRARPNVHPPVDVATPVRAGPAHVLAHGERHLPAARWSSSAICTPDADAPTTSTSPRRAESGLRYSRGVSVVTPPGGRRRGGQLGLAGRTRSRARRRALPLAVVGRDRTRRRFAARTSPSCRSAPVRRVPRIPVRNRRARHRHVPVGVAPRYACPGRRHPVRREERERVPSLRAPRVATSPRSSTTWSIARSVEVVARRQPALTRADDDHGGTQRASAFAVCRARSADLDLERSGW